MDGGGHPDAATGHRLTRQEFLAALLEAYPVYTLSGLLGESMELVRLWQAKIRVEAVREAMRGGDY
jgi:hypothetical protein